MGLRQKVSEWLSGGKGPAVPAVTKSDSMGGGFNGLPAYWFARAIEGGQYERLAEPYRNSVWVQNAIAKIAGPVASVPICFFKPSRETAGLKGRLKAEGKRLKSTTKAFRTSTGIVRRSLDDQVEVPAMQGFLRAPMPGLGYADFVEASIGWLCMEGEWFWLPVDVKPFPEVAKTALQVVVARPDRMREQVEDNQLVGWEYRDGQGRPQFLTPSQLVQEKRWNPYNQWRGLAQWEAAQIATEADWLAGRFARNLMANNGDTGPFIVAKNGIPSDPQREQIVADLKAKRQAQLRGDFRPVFMTGDITVEDPKVHTVDANFISMRLNSREEIFAAFNVPPSLSQVKEAYSIGSASDFYQLITTTCIPAGEKFADAVERLTYLLTGEQVEVLLDWDEHPVMQEVRKERFASIDTFWNKGVPMQTIDEMLGLEMPDYEGKDVGYLPISVTPAAEVLAEPPPGDNPALAENPAAEVPNSNPQAPEEEEQTPSPKPQAREEEPSAVRDMIKALRSKSLFGVQKGNTRQRLWAKHMRMRSGTVRAFQSKVSRVLNDFRSKALSRMSAVSGASKKGLVDVYGPEGVVQKSLIDLIFDPAEFGKQLVLSLNPLQQAALQTAGTQLMSEIGRVDPWKFPPEQALEFSRRREQAVQNCGATVRAQLNTALSEGYEAGESTDKLADRVRGVFNNLSKGEAERIARTETSAAFGFARDTAMKSAGIQYKEWLTSGGPNVREDHLEAEGQRVPIDEPFHVGGEDLMYPGDESGSPGNIINCQCVQVAVKGPEE